MLLAQHQVTQSMNPTDKVEMLELLKGLIMSSRSEIESGQTDSDLKSESGGTGEGVEFE